MFRVAQKVTMIDPRPGRDEADGEVYPEFGGVYTIRDIERGIDGSRDTFLTFHEIRNERYGYLDDYGEAAFFAGYFRPIVDMSDLEAIEARNEPRRNGGRSSREGRHGQVAAQ